MKQRFRVEERGVKCQRSGSLKEQLFEGATMLILSRATGERIKIGDDVIVKVTEIRGGRVKLGLEAPDRTRVMRAELEQPGATEVVPIRTAVGRTPGGKTSPRTGDRWPRRRHAG